MSLAIDVDRVAAVLLADGWHKVDFDEKGVSSFALDAYEFIREHGQGKAPDLLHGGGQSDVCAIGATWLEKDASFYCPLTSVLAVRYDAKGGKPKLKVVPPRQRGKTRF